MYDYLPKHIINYIYEFDNTYKDYFSQHVLPQVLSYNIPIYYQRIHQEWYPREPLGRWVQTNLYRLAHNDTYHLANETMMNIYYVDRRNYQS